MAHVRPWQIARRWWPTKRTECRNTLWVLWDWFPFLLTEGSVPGDIGVTSLVTAWGSSAFCLHR
jgi:hypothetical protein